jgi:hypothetical protein
MHAINMIDFSECTVGGHLTLAATQHNLYRQYHLYNQYHASAPSRGIVAQQVGCAGIKVDVQQKQAM